MDKLNAAQRDSQEKDQKCSKLEDDMHDMQKKMAASNKKTVNIARLYSFKVYTFYIVIHEYETKLTASETKLTASETKLYS